jgi:hypothetical protein
LTAVDGKSIEYGLTSSSLKSSESALLASGKPVFMKSKKAIFGQLN